MPSRLRPAGGSCSTVLACSVGCAGFRKICGVPPRESAGGLGAGTRYSTYQRRPDSAKNGELNIFRRTGAALTAAGSAAARRHVFDLIEGAAGRVAR
jgi:hypothetical protein